MMMVWDNSQYNGKGKYAECGSGKKCVEWLAGIWGPQVYIGVNQQVVHQLRGRQSGSLG